MWSYRYIGRMDFATVAIIIALMGVSFLVIASYSVPIFSEPMPSLSIPEVQSQLKRFLLGWLLFFFFACFDYNKLREWAWIIYLASIVSLIGVFFCEPIQHVHRWYRLPGLGFSFQPSEYAKLAVVIALSWFLERRALCAKSWGTAFGGLLIVGVPFILVLKQPDLGTALVLYPMTLAIFYFGNVHPWIIRAMLCAGCIAALVVGLFFTGIISHEKARPYASLFLKEYQYERLNPHTHHQKAASLAISIGGLTGVGWKESEYARGGSLPTPYTDSAFSAFGEEFGCVGLIFVLVLFYGLIYRGFQVTCVAPDAFGRLLGAGITVFLTVHILVNTSMMCGFVPITGVPLVIVSFGGSSVVCTMIALGILQSIYSRRFMF